MEEGWVFRAQRAGIGCVGVSVWEEVSREATPLSRMTFMLRTGVGKHHRHIVFFVLFKNKM